MAGPRGGHRTWVYSTQQDPIGIAGGANVYGFASGDPVNFSDPFGLCPPEKTKKPCPAGGITLQPGNGGLSSGILTTGAMTIAEQTGKHVSIHGGSRTFNPDGSDDASEHRTDLGGGGAIDFHLTNEDGTRVPDAEAVDLIMKTGGMPDGTRLIYHGPATNTGGEHLHMDKRPDIGNRREERGEYRPLKKP